MSGHLHSPRMKFDATPRAQVRWVLSEAHSLAHVLGMSVEVDIRGVSVLVTPRSDLEQLGHAYFGEVVRREGELVGPCERES